MAPSNPPRATEQHRVDPKIWRACAGGPVQIPNVNARVCYFPQGHIEQSLSSLPHLSPHAHSRPVIHCRVVAVDFLADPTTDEVFAKLLLHPVNPASFGTTRPGSNERDNDGEEKVVSFAKILTQSDANTGGGFSVPRFCADSVFPPLNLQENSPVQKLKVTDVHGVVWEFRHIYRGNPRRHLLTTGWSKFVNAKKLVAGDTVVFMRDPMGKLFVGIRRVSRSTGCEDYAKWKELINGMKRKGNEVVTEDTREGDEVRKRFPWSGRGKVSAESVAKSIEQAAQDSAFEVVYYPKAGWSDFVVKAEAVEAALNVLWTAGMRVKMAVETEDSSRMTWYQGTISSVSVPGSQPWRGSPWRMLQVTWDDTGVLQNSQRVSPWQVEFVEPTALFHPPFPSTKKLRVSQSSGYLTAGEGDMFFPMTGLPDPTMGHFKPALLNYNSFPVGIQGARQNTFNPPSSSTLTSENTPNTCFNKFLGKNVMSNRKIVSTDLNIGASHSGNLSPDTLSSLHSSGTEVAGNRSFGSVKLGVSSFQLFGKIIHVDQAVESSSFSENGSTEEEVTKGCNETGGLSSPLGLSLTFPSTKLVDRLNDRCQSASTFEACSF